MREVVEPDPGSAAEAALPVACGENGAPCAPGLCVDGEPRVGVQLAAAGAPEGGLPSQNGLRSFWLSVKK